MRQRGARSIHATIMTLLRQSLLLVLAGCLAFASLPVAVMAAPPEPKDVTVAGDTSDKASPDRETPRNNPAAPGDTPSSDRTTGSGLAVGWGSVRRRGLEAPVQLRPPARASAAPQVEQGDGVPTRSSAQQRKKPQDKDEREASSQQRENKRIWPMRAKSYTFTQAFGCVPQIANFYFPGDGCPADAPVIHSGVDLAAPEGTPFYAAAAGWVTDSGYDREVGVPNTRIIIQHVGRNEGYATEYLHWIASYVEVGDYVEAGELIGEVGSVGYSTGPHLHFSVVDLESGENTDPIGWLPETPGNEGYRGQQPNGKASMRLPAGTTAGLPEMADPAPPPPPERQDVPDSPREGKRDGKKDGKRNGERREERAAKRDKAATAPTDQSTEDASAGDGAADDASNTKKEGKRKDRTHKRERNKDGQSREDAAGGEDGDNANEDAKSDKPKSNDKGNRDNRGNHRGKGNGNGRDSGYRDQRDKKRGGNQSGGGGKNDKGSDNNGANDAPDSGKKPGGSRADGASGQTDPSDDGSTENGNAGEQPADDGTVENGETGKSTDEAPSEGTSESSGSGSDARAAREASDGQVVDPEAKARGEKSRDAEPPDS